MKSVHPSSMFRAAIISILVILAGVLVAAPAQAAAFRYWGYYHLANGAWVFSNTGPAQAVPADGSVEGWRFAVADVNSIRDPRATPTFGALCADTPPKAGTKRVGLVIDYGRPADSADGATPPVARATCVAVPERATGTDVLAAAATLRMGEAQTCGIDGWPATGCSLPVDPVPPAAASPDTDITIAVPKASAPTSREEVSSIGPLEMALGAAAVVLIAALGFAGWRRGRDATDG